MPRPACRDAVKIAFMLLSLWLFVACAHISSTPTTETWKRQYSHLEKPRPTNNTIHETDYYIVFIVAAYHLDYLDNKELITSLTHYGRNKGYIGHSWVYLKGIKEGQPYSLEGGHTGQWGKSQPRLYEGVINYLEYGYANPTDSQKSNPRYEPDPIKYLWEEFHDGHFQKGNGGHRATYAAKVDLTEGQFRRILNFMDPGTYPYGTFSLVGNQCSSLVAKLAAMAGLYIEDQVTVKIDPFILVGKRQYRLWTDPRYSEITFSTPDVIERSLMDAVSDGRAEYALGWYLDR